MHVTSGRWQYGLALALSAALLWGMLPIALSLLLVSMDAVTITWYRFLAAAILLGGYLRLRRRLPRLSGLRRADWVLLVIAIAGLCGNYLLYLLGLRHVSPGTAQVLIQLAPLFLLIGGLTVFRERSWPLQWLGFAALIAGMAMFFHEPLRGLSTAQDPHGTGAALIVVSALLWAAYAMAQKQLLETLSAEGIMLLIYAASVLVFLPGAAPAGLLALDGTQLSLLAFCCLNTLLAYGSFAEALVHWEASRISAVLALSPLLTLGFMALLQHAHVSFPVPEQIDAMRLAGATLVVVGSMLGALGSPPRS